MSNGKNVFHEKAFEQGWEWFKYHADQRLTLMRYYLILVGAVSTACLTTLEKGLPYAAAGAALFGVVCSLSFFALDQRVSELVKVGEKLMAKEQEKLSSELGYDAIKTVYYANQCKAFFLGSYRRAFRFLVGFGLIMFLVTAAVSLASGMKSENTRPATEGKSIPQTTK